MTEHTDDGGTDSWTDTGSVALAKHAPEALTTYTLLVSVRPLGVHDEMLESPEVSAFAAQLHSDVAGLDDELRSAFERATGQHAAAVIDMVWIADVGQRIREALDALFGPSAAWPGSRRHPVADTGAVVAGFVASIPPLDPDLPEAARALREEVGRTPTTISPEVVAAVREQLTPTQAVAVVLDVARESAAKIEVARGSVDDDALR